MIKKKKIISAIMVAAMSVGLFGCSQKGLMGAIENSQNMKSYEMKQSAEINFDNPQLSKNEQQNLNSIDSKKLEQIAMPNIKFSVNGKMQQEKDKWAKCEMKVNYDMALMKMDMNMFLETATKDDKTDFKMFMQVPEILKQQNVEEISKADYLYMDSKTMEKTLNGQQNPMSSMSDMTKNMTNMQSSFNEFIKEYANESGKETIVNKGKIDIKVNGKTENAEMYEVKITKESLSKFLEAYSKDEKRKEELQKLIKTMIPQNNGTADIKDLKKLADFIGKDGITMTFGVKDNFIIKQNVKMHLLVENMGMHYNIEADIFSINDDKIKVEMPDKNKVKVVDFNELLKAQGNIQ